MRHHGKPRAPCPPPPLIVSIGEPLIEFNRPKEGDGRTWLQGFGGDSQNVAIAAVRQGASAGYLTSLGQDWMGDAFLDLWKSEGVDASKVTRHPTAPTGVSFVTHGPAGHKFDYLRKGSAASLMTPDDLPKDYIAGARFLHVSAIGQAISADAPRRVRPRDRDRARRRREGLVRHQPAPAPVGPRDGAAGRSTPPSQAATSPCRASTIRSSSPASTRPDEIADFYLELGAPMVALKMGSDGALLACPDKRIRIAPHRVQSVDATGAGDTFDGAFLARLLEGDDPETAARYANVAAALSTTGYGAVTPIPRKDAVMAALKAQS